MRHVYSLVRFVPDPARGESINIGVLAGSDASGEWSLRTIENLRRASQLDDQNVLPGVMASLARIGVMAERWTTHPQLALEIGADEPLGEQWLRRLGVESRNVMQFSEPLAVAAESADEAIEAVWDDLIVEPSYRRYRFEKKYRAVGAVKEALAAHHISAANVLEKASISGRIHHARADFVVFNGVAQQLAQCWSFQLPDKAALIEDIKAWAWTVRDIRMHGGSASSAGTDVTIGHDAPIAAVYVPALGPDATFEEALQAFRDPAVNIRAVAYSDADTLIGAVAEGLAAHH